MDSGEVCLPVHATRYMDEDGGSEDDGGASYSPEVRLYAGSSLGSSLPGSPLGPGDRGGALAPLLTEITAASVVSLRGGTTPVLSPDGSTLIVQHHHHHYHHLEIPPQQSSDIAQQQQPIPTVIVPEGIDAGQSVSSQGAVFSPSAAISSRPLAPRAKTEESFASCVEEEGDAASDAAPLEGSASKAEEHLSEPEADPRESSRDIFSHPLGGQSEAVDTSALAMAPPITDASASPLVEPLPPHQVKSVPQGSTSTADGGILARLNRLKELRRQQQLAPSPPPPEAKAAASAHTAPSRPAGHGSNYVAAPAAPPAGRPSDGGSGSHLSAGASRSTRTRSPASPSRSSAPLGPSRSSDLLMHDPSPKPSQASLARRQGSNDSLGVSSFAAMLTAAQAAIMAAPTLDPLHQQATERDHSLPPSRYPPVAPLPAHNPYDRRDVIGGLPGGQLTLGHGATGMSLDFAHLTSSQQNQQCYRHSVTSDSYGGDSGFESVGGSPISSYPVDQSSVIAGVGSGWAWAGASPGPVTILGQGGDLGVGSSHFTVVASPHSGHSGSPSVSHQSSGGMAWGSPVPGATSEGGSAIGIVQGTGSSGGPQGGRGRTRARTTDGESSPTAGLERPSVFDINLHLFTICFILNCDQLCVPVLHFTSDQAIIVVGPQGGVSGPIQAPMSRSSSPPASARLRRSSSRSPAKAPYWQQTKTQTAQGPPLPPRVSGNISRVSDEVLTTVAATDLTDPSFSGGLPLQKQQDPTNDGAPSTSSSLTAALLRLKRMRLQSASVAPAAPSSSVSVAASAGRVRPSGVNSSEGGGEGPMRSEDVNLRRVRSAAPGPRSAAAMPPQAPSGRRISGAGAPPPGYAHAPAHQMTAVAGGGTDADVDTEAEGGGKQFLKRRSKAVVAKKLDWSHVKPRTVTSR